MVEVSGRDQEPELVQSVQYFLSEGRVSEPLLVEQLADEDQEQGLYFLYGY